MELTLQQQRAVAAASDTPAREGGRVLLPAADFEWIRGLIPDLPDVARATDPHSGRAYALVPEAVYERFKAFFEEDPITPAERQALLRDFGRRVGWDDPEMDVYEQDRERP